MEDLLLKWEGVITALVALCAVIAIALGIVWLFLRKDTLLFTVLGFNSCYFIGRDFPGLRNKRSPMEN
jgi:ABC-type branched-subunit amino acid transport system permease subunit